MYPGADDEDAPLFDVAFRRQRVNEQVKQRNATDPIMPHPAPNIEEVWIDPNRQSSDPVVRGVPTSVLAELFRAGDSITQIADWYELQRTEVEAALRYEQLTAAGAA